MTGVLTLNLENQCNGGKCRCDSGISILKAKKEVDHPVKGFTKYTHYLEEKTFELNRTLADSDTIKATVTSGRRIGQPIEDVKEVSVYYWNGAPTNPIIIGIAKGSSQPTYYGRSGPGNPWMNGWVEGRSLLQALDKQNCHNNNAVPFNIQDSMSGYIPNDSKSSCIDKYKNITESSSKHMPPPGSNYDVKEYTISGGNARISRVTLRGDSVDINLTKHNPISKIRLYSYHGSGFVPLMLEFKPSIGESEWHYATDANGKNWTTTSGNSFYDGGGITPQSALSEQLDDILCSQSSNVTMDLTHGKYTGGKNQCCGTHKKEIATVHGTVQVKGSDAISTEYYKYSLPRERPNLAGIYYKDNISNRNNIKIGGLPFSSFNPISIYAFYCTGNGPSLIYVDSQSAMARGWYKKEVNGDNWRWAYTGLERKDFEQSGLECRQWIKLRIVLGQAGCGCYNLPDCPNTLGTEQLEKELKEELEREEKIEREKRNQAITEEAKKQKQAAVHGPSSSGTSSSSSGSSSGTGGGSAATLKAKTCTDKGLVEGIAGDITSVIVKSALLGAAGLGLTLELADKALTSADSQAPTDPAPSPSAASSGGSGRDMSSVYSSISSTSYSSQQDDTGTLPEVTVNIYNRSVIGQSIYASDSSNVYVTPNSNIAGFTESTHKVQGGNYFTLQGINYDKKPTSGILKTPIPRVTTVSVFYWTALETGKRGRPLLVKVVTKAPTGEERSTYYENVSSKLDDNSKWQVWKPITTRGVTTGDLEGKLTSLNCNLNHVVSIKVNQIAGSYCGHLKTHNHGRVKVSEIGQGSLGKYKAYKHELNKAYPGDSDSTHTFHISALKNWQGITLDGIPTPVLDVSSITVYFCGREVYASRGNNPLLMYIDSAKLGKENKWFHKLANGGYTWKSVELPTNEDQYDKILDLLDTLNSSCKPPSVTIDIYKRGTSSTQIFYSHDSWSNRILVTGARNSPNGFTEYQHTISGRSIFGVKTFQYNGGSITGGLTGNTSNITSVSVYYYTTLDSRPKGPPDERGRPLLLKILKNGKSPLYYENTGDTGDLNWTKWKDNASQSEIQSKLHLLSCKLNSVVTLDLSYDISKRKGNWYCCTYHSDNEKKIYAREVPISCQEHGPKLPYITAYRHFMGDKTKIADIRYYDGGQSSGTGTRKNITVTGLSFPTSNIQALCAVYCEKKNPILIYVESGDLDTTGWYQKG